MKYFNITKYTLKYVYMKWECYGNRRGLSLKIDYSKFLRMYNMTPKETKIVYNNRIPCLNFHILCEH